MPPPESAAEKRRSPISSSTSPQGTSSLIREEFELAKAEVTEKVGKLLRGSVVGIAAGAFAFLALILVMEGIAWLLNEEVFDGKTLAGLLHRGRRLPADRRRRRLLIAYRSVKAGAPPVPEQAIEEAKLTKTMFEGEAESAAENVQHSVVKGGGK